MQIVKMTKKCSKMLFARTKCQIFQEIKKVMSDEKVQYTEFIQAALLTTSLLVNLNLGQQLSK